MCPSAFLVGSHILCALQVPWRWHPAAHDRFHIGRGTGVAFPSATDSAQHIAFCPQASRIVLEPREFSLCPGFAGMAADQAGVLPCAENEQAWVLTLASELLLTALQRVASPSFTPAPAGSAGFGAGAGAGSSASAAAAAAASPRAQSQPAAPGGPSTASSSTSSGAASASGAGSASRAPMDTSSDDRPASDASTLSHRACANPVWQSTAD